MVVLFEVILIATAWRKWVKPSSCESRALQEFPGAEAALLGKMDGKQPVTRQSNQIFLDECFFKLFFQLFVITVEMTNHTIVRMLVQWSSTIDFGICCVACCRSPPCLAASPTAELTARLLISIGRGGACGASAEHPTP